MSISTTLRMMLKKYSSGADPHPSREEFNLMIDALENNAAMFSEGATGARPLAGKRGRFFWDTTVFRMSYDNGTAWYDLNPNGGGGIGAKVVPAVAATEGTSARSARADHTHTMDLATALIDGAMAKADKAKLDAATEAATAGTLAKRDTSGRMAVGVPNAASHATTKAYVDAADNTRRIVCTSATRPTGADRVAGLTVIYETDTKREALWDGTRWQVMSQPHTLYNPEWRGFPNLGSGYTSGGSYAVIGPRMVRANMFLRAGAGAVLGTGRLAVSLPFPASGYPQQFGIGSHLESGPAGLLRALFCATGGGGDAVELWAWPNHEFFTSVMRTIGDAGYTFGQNVEIHMNITYESADIG
jgi:hypothetical protein